MDRLSLKPIQRMLALFLSVLMVINMVPLNVFAVELNDSAEDESNSSEELTHSLVQSADGAYWICTDCGQYFEDEAGTVPFDPIQTVEDEASCVHESYELVSETEVTCNTAGVKVEKCASCGEEKRTYTVPEIAASSEGTGVAWDFTQAEIVDSAISSANGNITLAYGKKGGKGTGSDGTATAYQMLVLENGNLLSDKSFYNFSEGIALNDEDGWTMEIVAKLGEETFNETMFRGVFATGIASKPFVLIRPGADLMICTSGGTSSGYFFKLSDEDFTNNIPTDYDPEVYHNYQLRYDNGEYWYYLDGEPMGKLGLWEQGWDRDPEGEGKLGAPTGDDATAIQNMTIKRLGSGSTSTANVGFSGYIEYMGVYPTGHMWDDGETTLPDCDTAGKTVYNCTAEGCSAYSEVILEATGHSWDNDCDTTCNVEGCGHTREIEHDWDEGVVTKEPAYPENGIRTYTCTVCGETKEETIEASCQHSSLTETPAVAVKCTQDGNSAYWICNACGLYFSDAAASQVIEKDSWIITATGHSYAVTSETASSCNTTGVKVETCSGCGDVKTFYTPATTGYFWDFSQGSATSIQGENTLTVDVSKISGATMDSLLADGTLNTLDGLTRLKMSKPVTLKASDSWVMEVTARGTGENALGTIISTDRLAAASTFVRIMKSGDLLIVKRTPTDGIGGFEGKTPVYYKVSDEDFNNSVLASEGFTTADYHTYQLRCDNGVFSFWLDGVKVGDLAITEATTSREEGDFAYEGTPFNFDELEINYVGIGTADANATQGLQAELMNLAIYPGHAFDHACDSDCNNEGCTYTRETEHALTHVPAVANNCQQSGNLEYWECEKCGALFSDADAQTATTLDAVTLAQSDHDFGAPSFDWAEDYSTCTVSFKCSAAEHTESVDCTVTSQTTSATCVDADVTEYTATAEFNGKTHTDTKTLTGEALGHTYGEAEFNWAADGKSATASVTCSVCAESEEGHKLEGAAAVTATDSTDGDCKTKATTTYGAKITLDGKEYEASKTVEGTYGTHSMTETPAKAATCQAEGNNAYWTCSICGNVYKNKDGSEQTTVEAEILAKKDHSYGGPSFDWAADYESCKASFFCSEGSHTDTLDCTIQKESGDATCTTPGTVKYTATVEIGGNTYTETKTLTGEALGHTYGEAEFNWAADGKSATASVTCSVCAESVEGHKLEGTAAVTVTGSTDGDCKTKATTTYGAKITLGGKEYEASKTVEGTYGTHSLTETPAKAATCAAEGNNAYWTCTICGNVYKDKNGSEQTTAEAEILAKKAHTYGTAVFDWAQDGTSATASITCSACEEGVEGHKLEDAAAVTVTGSTDGDCKTKATTTYGAEITLNGQKYTDSKTVEGDLGSHKLTKTEAVEDTCAVAGHAAYWTCSVCDKLFADENGTTEIPAVEYIDEVADTVWTFANGSADSDNGNNSLSIIKSAISGATMDSLITDGTLNTLAGKTTLEISKAVTLGASDSWIMEVTARGDGTNPINVVFSTGKVSNSATFIRIMATGDLVLGKSTPASGENSGFGTGKLVFYKVSDEDYNNSALTSESFTTADYHTYQLRRDNGVFSFWLDGEKVGDLTITEAAPNRANREEGALVYEGTPFTFGDLQIDTLGAGTTKNYALQGMQAEVKALGIYPGHAFDHTCDPDCNNEGCTYTREIAHELTHVPAVASNCQQTGNLEYWECETCGALFSDANAQTVTTLAEVTLAQSDHVYGAASFNWAADGKSATASATCSVCAESVEGAAAVAATGSTDGDCKTKATTTYTAKITFGGKEYEASKTVEGDYGTHSMTETPAKAATCQAEGNNAYWTCSICGNVYKNMDGSEQTTVEAETLTKKAHIYGAPSFDWAEDSESCKASFFCSEGSHTDTVDCTIQKESGDATCTTPGTVKYTATVEIGGKTHTDTKTLTGEVLGHTYGEAEFNWAADCKSATASVTCSVCAESVEGHKLEGAAAVTVTGSTDGDCKTKATTTYGAKITLGGKEYEASKTVEGTYGTHSMTETPAKAATCAAEGNNAYWTCSVCGNVYKDKNGSEQTTAEAEILAKKAHTYGVAVFDWAQDGTSATASITCSACEEGVEGHKLEDAAAVTVTGSTDGDCKTKATTTYGAEITLNGQKYTDSKTVEGVLSSHKLTKTEAVEDTCAVAGHAAYWTCSVCDKLFADENGTTEIPAVEYIDEVSDTVWTFANGSADSDNGNNSLSVIKSAISGATMDSLITGGTLNTLSGKTTLVMSQAVTLGASDSWIMEVTARGDGTNPINVVFSTGLVYTSATFVRIMASGDLVLGKYTPSDGTDGGFGAKKLVFYKVSDEDFNNSVLTSEGFTTADYHTYQLRRDNGVFSFWLDGEKVGDLTITEAAASRSSRKEGALVYPGTPFTFGDLKIDTLGTGTAKDYAYNGMQAEIKSLSIYNAHSFTDACDPDCNADGCTFTRDVMHTWDAGVVTIEPTETENGEKTYTCGSCGTTRKESINALQHKHQMAATEAKAPDCENTGNTAYWTCTGCGKYFSDAEGNTEIAENSWVIEAKGHAWDNGVVTKAPTSSEEGERLFTCACGATKTEKIPVGEAVSKDIVWDFSQNSATSTNGKNTLSITAAEDGTTDINNLISDGVLNTLSSKAALKLSESITLGASEYWSMEIVAKGNGSDNIEGFFSTSSAGTSATFIRIMNSGDLMIVKRLVGASDPVFSNGTYLNYKVSNEDFNNSVLGSGNFDVTEYHTYELRRENGVFSYWLDGVKIGDLTVTEDAASRTGTQAAGTPFNFKDLTISHVGNGTSSKPTMRGLQAAVKSMAIYAGHSFTDDCDEICNDAGCTYTRTVMHDLDEGVVTIEPSVTAKGEKTYTCKICGTTEKEEIPVLAHTHKMIATQAVEAGCETPGNIAYWTCSVCGHFFSDVAGETQIEKDSWIVKAKGHRWNSGEITKAPTNTEPGERTYTCTVCSATKVEPISAAAEVVMKYDDRLAVSELGQTGAPVISNQTVTSRKVGTDTLDDAVVTYVNGKLIAVGVGHATITWGEGDDAVKYNLTVEPATISLIMVTGHSMGSGSEGSAEESIVCEEGQVYSTNEKAYSFKLCTGSSSAGTVEGKDVTGMGIGYSSSLRPSKINALNEAGSGVTGVDSGIGYRWHQLTGEKIWVLNSAKGSTNLSTWKEGGYNYRHAVALFTTAEEILYNETQAGHYIVNKLGIVNFGPGNGDQNWTADLYRESFDSMWNGFQTEMAVYDFDGDGVKDTVDCIGRIPGRNVCAMNDWNNLYQYPLAFHSLKTSGAASEGRLVGYHMSVFEDKGVIKASLITRNWTTDADVKAYFEEHPIETLYGTLQNGSTHSNPTTVRNGVLADGTHCTQLGYNVHGVVIAENMYKYWYGLNTVESVTLLQVNGVDEVPDSIKVPMGSKYVIVPMVTPSSGKLTYTVTGDAFSYYNCMVVGEKLGSGVLTIKTLDGTVLKTVNVTVVEAEEEENYENAEWYVWDFAEGSATNTSGSTLDNTLSLVASQDSSVTSVNDILNNGILDASSKTVLKLSKPVALDSSKNWTVEIVAKGDGENPIRTVLSTNRNYSGTYIFINAKGDLSIVKKCSFIADDGTSVSSGYTNYKVSDDDYYSSILVSSDFDVTEYHSYQLSCNKGVFSFWVDGEKIGDLAMSEQSSNRGSGALQYTQGNGAAFNINTLTMNYIGNGSSSTAYAHGLNASVKKLSIVCGSGTLTLESNLGAAASIDPMVIYPGYSITLPKPDTGNYCAKFIGWATNQDLSGTVYEAGETFTVTELNSTTLYGVWETNDTTDAIHNVVDNVCTYCGATVHTFTARVAEENYLCTEATMKKPATYYYSCPCCGQSSRGTAYESVFEYGRPGDGYYSVISETTWEIAPGIVESELVLNNDSGERRQVVHLMEVDTSDPYVMVMPSYMGMNPTSGNYKLGTMSQQTAWVEENMGLNVVGAMNTSLSWYNSEYYTQNPELKGEPTGVLVIDGTVYSEKTDADTCLVINYDTKDGENRPASMPKVELRYAKDGLTGWEEQVIPCNFGFVVKDGKNTVSESHENQASKSILGIKEDGTIVIMQVDGRLAPYSNGVSVYEAGEIMIKQGCTYAVRCDGGGSSTYLSQRPGEELQVNNTPSDGVERTTTTGIMVITTAPSDGSFARASITADNNYYAPNSKVTFTAVGSDIAGTWVEIPKDAEWQIKESGMGTIKDGVFTSNGTTGKVTAQLVYNNKVVGECTVEIVIPETFRFQQKVITVPYGKTVELALVSTVNNGLNTVSLNPADIQITTTNAALGTFNGITFTAVEEDKAPADVTSTITATLKNVSGMTAQAQLNLGKGSEIIEDFENGLDEWRAHKRNENHQLDFVYADSSSGYVYDGDHAAGLVMLNADQRQSAMSYSQIGLVSQKEIYIENALSVGAWVYIPDDFYNLWLRLCVYAKDDEGEYTVIVSKDFLNGGEVYTDIEESGWHYFSLDVSEYESIMISPRLIFVELISQHCSANEMLQTVGGSHGMSRIYIDDISVDYSAAADDREPPIFKSVTMAMNGTEVDLVKHEMVTTTSNVVNIQAVVAEDEMKTNATGLNVQSAKAFVDGMSVDVAYADGILSLQNVALANGPHRVRFEISDYAGNTASVIRMINVKSDVNASTVEVVPADPSLDRLYGGSVYWMDVNANMIQTIQEVSFDIDLNAVNHWELDHMEVAEGFTATYSVNEMTNTATVTITRTGENLQAGKQTLASLPIRVIYYDTDIANENYTAETFWKERNFWPQNVAVDVDRGIITYTEGYSSKVLNTFSNTEFRVDTEFYTSAQHMDPEFRAERGTAHVHTVEALEDKTGSCSEAGYTGRTFCYVCNSVVDWGTKAEATSHNYEVVDGKLVCECGAISDLTGFYQNPNNGRWMYFSMGESMTGFVLVGNQWHYFKNNGYAATGTYTINGLDYKFEGEQGKVIGAWEETSKGTRFYFCRTYYNNTWAQIEGETYYFGNNGYRAEGTVNLNHLNEDLGCWEFTEDGKLVGPITGVFQDAKTGYYHYAVDGEMQYSLGLIVWNDAIYYVRGNGRLATTDWYIGANESNGLVPAAGTYTFLSDGRLYIDCKDEDDHFLNEGIVRVEPTCSQTGKRDHVCLYCGESVTAEIPTIEHKWQSDYTIDKPATETTDGLKSIHCDNCDATKDEQVIPATGEHVHNWNEGVVTVEPTCTQTGKREYVCLSCGETKTTVIPTIAHKWQSNYTVDKPATETTDGLMSIHCENCNATKDEQVIPATGKHVHSWGAWVVTKAPTATAVGEETRTCTACGKTEKREIAKLTHPFVDVEAGRFYEIPVIWAVNNDITTGMDATHFVPNGECTRAQVVTFLWRAAGKPAPTSTYNPFTDVEKGKFYYDAVLWAVEEGITNGMTATTFEPSTICNRGQVATFLWRYMGKPGAVSAKNPFTDVEKGRFYYDAVLWAVENEITNGMTTTTFEPNTHCSRGQIVTFLYRAVAQEN